MDRFGFLEGGAHGEEAIEHRSTGPPRAAVPYMFRCLGPETKGLAARK